jgi:hypothetical protein
VRMRLLFAVIAVSSVALAGCGGGGGGRNDGQPLNPGEAQAMIQEFVGSDLIIGRCDLNEVLNRNKGSSPGFYYGCFWEQVGNGFGSYNSWYVEDGKVEEFGL